MTVDATDPPQSDGPHAINEPVAVNIIVPAVVVPVVGAGAIVLGVLLGLRRKKQQKKQIKNPVNSIVLTTPTDRRLLPHNSITLDKEIGSGSYGKGMCASLCTVN